MGEVETPRERAVLLDSLTTQREYVLEIVEGLSDDDLQRSMLPSGWTSIGLIRHLTIDVESFWFRDIVGGEVIDFGGPEVSAWELDAGESPTDVLARYRHEIKLADDVLSSVSLDAPTARWPTDMWPTWRLEDVREVIQHVITETACHVGHLDATRELIDGRRRS